MKMKLKDEHPTMQKMMKLCELADELGIHITYMGDVAMITDRDFPNRLMRLEDIESNNSPMQFPITCEFRITFEK